MPSPDQNSALGAYGLPPPPTATASTKGYKKNAAGQTLLGNLPADYQTPLAPYDASVAGYPTGYGPMPPASPTGGLHDNVGYVQGDEWAPAQDLNVVPTIQADLVQMGYLKPADVRPGVWDATSAAAYAKVLEFANYQGISSQDALTLLVQNPSAAALKSARGKSGALQPAIVYTNPQDVQTAYANVSQNLTGQEQQPGGFQSYYHGLEDQAQHQRGQNYTRAPTLTGAATQYIQQNDPSQVQAYGIMGKTQDFFHMLDSSGLGG